jgi:hypothetical protein
MSMVLIGGMATFDAGIIDAGDHALVADYAAQGNFDHSSQSGTLHVSAAQSSMTIAAPTITYGAHGSVAVTVTSGAGTPSGNVTLTVDGGAPMSMALSGGIASFDVGILNVGDHNLLADYAPQGNFGHSSQTGTLHVNPMIFAFSAFNAEADIGRHEFEVHGSFTLGPGSDGIAPLSENVTLKLGSFSITIPVGSFHRKENGQSVFDGTMNGVDLEFVIRPRGGNRFEFSVEGEGAGLSGLRDPLSLTLAIGNDLGTASLKGDKDGNQTEE